MPFHWFDSVSSIHDDSAKTQAAVLALGTKVDTVAAAAIATGTEMKVLAAQVGADRERSDSRAREVEAKLGNVEGVAARDRESMQRRIDEILRAIVNTQKSATPAAH
jgi:hypothetical protein